MNQKKKGIIISYCNLAIGMFVNIFLTPYLIYTLGDVDYSMYKVMQSFSGPLTMFHFGVATIVTRSIIRFKNSDDYKKEDKENTIALALLSSLILVLIIFIASIIMYFQIPVIYGVTYDKQCVVLGQQVFVCFVASTIFHMLTDVSSGCLIGHEKYIISSGIQLFKTVFKVLIIVLFLNLRLGIVAVAMADLITAIIVFGFSLIYTRSVLKEVPKLHYFDKKQMLEILLYGTALFMQAFVNQINNSVDTMILGVYVEDKSIITMYSSALAIYAIYNSLISVITNYFLPSATKLVTKNATGKELTEFVIRPGRFQAIVAVACVCGFALCGKEFIILWIGDKYLNAYWVILMLIIPVTIPLVENAAISILDASLKRIYRSIVLIIMAVFNIIISIVLVQSIGFWGTVIGTAMSLIIGHGFLMNIYYAKIFNMEIVRMFCSIFKGILPIGIISVLISYPITLFRFSVQIELILKAICFCIMYVGMLWKFGLSENEKETLKDIVKI